MLPFLKIHTILLTIFLFLYYSANDNYCTPKLIITLENGNSAEGPTLRG